MFCLYKYAKRCKTYIHALQLLHQNPWFEALVGTAAPRNWVCSSATIELCAATRKRASSAKVRGRRLGDRRSSQPPIGWYIGRCTSIIWRPAGNKYHHNGAYIFQEKEDAAEVTLSHFQLQISGLPVSVSLCDGFEVDGVKKNMSTYLSHMAEQKRNMFKSHPDRFWLPQKLGASCNFLI